MTIVLLANQSEAERIKSLMAEYLREMAQFDPRAEPALKEYPYLDHYWREPDRLPFIISEQGQDCGFALIRRVRSGDARGDYHSIAEFFVQPKARRSRIGAENAKSIIQRFPGAWLIEVLELNQGALAFWPGVVSEVAGKDIQPVLDHGFYQFRFEA